MDQPASLMERFRIMDDEKDQIDRVEAERTKARAKAEAEHARRMGRR